RHDDAAAGTGLDVDVRIDAALADEFKPWQAFEQVGLNLRALADEHQAFGILEPRRQRLGVLHVVVKDRHRMTLELLAAGERAHRVEIVVENRNLHALRSANRWRRSRAHWAQDLTQSRSRIEPRPPRRRLSCGAESRGERALSS